MVVFFFFHGVAPILCHLPPPGSGFLKPFAIRRITITSFLMFPFC